MCKHVVSACWIEHFTPVHCFSGRGSSGHGSSGRGRESRKEVPSQEHRILEPRLSRKSSYKHLSFVFYDCIRLNSNSLSYYIPCSYQETSPHTWLDADDLPEMGLRFTHEVYEILGSPKVGQ